MQNAADYFKDVLSKPEKDTGYPWFEELKSVIPSDKSRHDIANILAYTPEAGTRLSINNCKQTTIKLTGRRTYTAAQNDLNSEAPVNHPTFAVPYIKAKLIPILWLGFDNIGAWNLCLNCEKGEYVAVYQTTDKFEERIAYNTSDLSELVNSVNEGENGLKNWKIAE